LLIAVAVLLSGCALQDSRYDYSGASAGFGPDYEQTILDWNFPTTHNQGPLLAPERFRPVRPAIGVPWATGNPMPWQQGAGVAPAGAVSAAASDEPFVDCAKDCEAAAPDARPILVDARARERFVPTERR
jgi:hypothetical protein